MATIKGAFPIEIQENRLFLLPEKVIFRPDYNELIISDLHIGKAAHFRKNGIPVHGMSNKNNFWMLSGIFDRLNPEKVMFLGDLSHSEHNKEWDDFADFIQNYPQITFHLITGNHDILSESQYEQAGIHCAKFMVSHEILYVHEFEKDHQLFTLCGHIHPAVRLSGNARQTARLPCFWLRQTNLVLPAFGDFTGKMTIKPSKEDRIFVATPEEVIEINDRVSK